MKDSEKCERILYYGTWFTSGMFVGSLTRYNPWHWLYMAFLTVLTWLMWYDASHGYRYGLKAMDWWNRRKNGKC